MYWHAMAIIENNFPQLVRMWPEELCCIDVLKRCCGSSGPIIYCCCVAVMGCFREFVLHWKGVGWRAINVQSTSILDKYVAAQWVRFRGYWVDTSRVTLRFIGQGKLPAGHDLEVSAMINGDATAFSLERTMELTLARTSFCPLHSSTRLFLWRLGGHVILNDPGTACIALVDVWNVIIWYPD